jgi:hypothetical protein
MGAEASTFSAYRAFGKYLPGNCVCFYFEVMSWQAHRMRSNSKSSKIYRTFSIRSLSQTEAECLRIVLVLSLRSIQLSGVQILQLVENSAQNISNHKSAGLPINPLLHAAKHPQQLPSRSSGSATVVQKPDDYMDHLSILPK